MSVYDDRSGVEFTSGDLDLDNAILITPMILEYIMDLRAFLFPDRYQDTLKYLIVSFSSSVKMSLVLREVPHLPNFGDHKDVQVKGGHGIKKFL